MTEDNLYALANDLPCPTDRISAKSATKQLRAIG